MRRSITITDKVFGTIVVALGWFAIGVLALAAAITYPFRRRA